MGYATRVPYPKRSETAKEREETHRRLWGLHIKGDFSSTCREIFHAFAGLSRTDPQEPHFLVQPLEMS